MKVNRAFTEENHLVFDGNNSDPDADLSMDVQDNQLDIQEIVVPGIYTDMDSSGPFILNFQYEEDIPMPSRLTWDENGKREFESGVDHVVLYRFINDGDDTTYEKGVAWNGVTAVNENPSGADATDLYADNIKYATLRSAENFGFSIEAYTYPDEWNECDGSFEGATGVYLGQQPRRAFGLCYRTKIGDDIHPGMDKGYKLHIIYNSTASPSGRGYTTINDNPDAITMSWDCSSTSVNVGSTEKKVSSIVIDSTKCDPDKLKDLEALLYGSTTADATLPSPASVITTMGGTL